MTCIVIKKIQHEYLNKCNISHLDQNEVTINSIVLTSVSFHMNISQSDQGGGYLVYLSDGDVPFFRVSFSPIFSRTGYQKKANFLEQVVKTYQKRKFCYNGLS